MNDRDIEDTRQPPDEEEGFVCDICKEDYILAADHIDYKNTLICIICAEDIKCELNALLTRYNFPK